MTTLHAFHDSHELKQLYIDRVLAHRKMDELVQGTGWEVNGKTRGCAVGCTLNVYDHARYPIELGIPQVLARLEDRLFELMPRVNAIGSTPSKAWPFRFLNAIEPGADLSKVWPQWAVWMLVDPEHGVIRFAKRQQTIDAINRVAQLWREGGTPEQFRQAQAAAAAAADDAAAAAYDAAADAAAAYDAAADAAAAAAYAASAASAAASAAAYAAAAADDAAAAADAAAAYDAAADAAAAAAYAYAAADAAAAAAADAAADAAYASGQKARENWAIVAADKLIELLAAA